jgi:hypothetical protein
VVLTKYYSGNQIKEGKMGRAAEKYVSGMVRKPAEKDNLEDIGVEGMAQVKLILKEHV